MAFRYRINIKRTGRNGRHIARYARLPELNARPNGGLVMDFGSGVGTTICYLRKISKS